MGNSYIIIIILFGLSRKVIWVPLIAILSYARLQLAAPDNIIALFEHCLFLKVVLVCLKVVGQMKNEKLVVDHIHYILYCIFFKY